MLKHLKIHTLFEELQPKKKIENENIQFRGNFVGQLQLDTESKKFF